MGAYGQRKYLIESCHATRNRQRASPRTYFQSCSERTVASLTASSHPLHPSGLRQYGKSSHCRRANSSSEGNSDAPDRAQDSMSYMARNVAVRPVPPRQWKWTQSLSHSIRWLRSMNRTSVSPPGVQWSVTGRRTYSTAGPATSPAANCSSVSADPTVSSAEPVGVTRCWSSFAIEKTRVVGTLLILSIWACSSAWIQASGCPTFAKFLSAYHETAVSSQKR